jgi:hypothetical protein
MRERALRPESMTHSYKQRACHASWWMKRSHPARLRRG